jgi:hypothetical protein
MARSVRKHVAHKPPTRGVQHLHSSHRPRYDADEEEARWAEEQWRLSDEDARYEQGGGRDDGPA